MSNIVIIKKSVKVENMKEISKITHNPLENYLC